MSNSTINAYFQSVVSKLSYKSPVKLSIVKPGERVITLEEVSWHDTNSDCWVIIYDRVYDITDFLNKHPGGSDILLEHAGRDATVAFRGSGHSIYAFKELESYLIGELPAHERLFRKTDGFKLSDIPE